MIFAVLLTACTKEADILQPMKPKNSIPGLQVEVQNGMLFFKDAIEYASFIEKSSADSLLDIISDYDGFTSCYEWMSDSNEVNFMHNLKEESETILKLLNKDGLVHIQNKVYRINSKTETVYMIDSSRAGSPAAIAALIAESGDGVTSESVERDLYELNGLPDAKAGPGTGCPFANKDFWDIESQSIKKCPSFQINGELKVRVDYKRYGVYFELYTRTWHPNFNENINYQLCQFTKMITNPVHFKKNGSVSDFYTTASLAQSNYGKKRWYGGGRRLCFFYLRSKAQVPQANPNETSYAEIKFNYQ